MLPPHAAAALALICASLASCQSENASDQAALPASAEIRGKLLLTGSNTIAPLMAEIAQRFQLLHPKVAINIEMGGSARGVSDARDGQSDIGMVSRVLTDKEQDLKGFPVARDGVGLIVHIDNPVTTLGAAQISDIFSGRIKNWNKVGGKNAPISVINRENGRGIVELFTQHFKITYGAIQAQAVVGDNALAIKAMTARPNAISMMSVIVAEGYIKAGVPIKLVALDGVAATRSNILTGNYPLARPLTLVTPMLPRGLAKSFIEYSLSSQVVDIVEKLGFVPYEE